MMYRGKQYKFRIAEKNLTVLEGMLQESGMTLSQLINKLIEAQCGSGKENEELHTSTKLDNN